MHFAQSNMQQPFVVVQQGSSLPQGYVSPFSIQQFLNKSFDFINKFLFAYFS